MSALPFQREPASLAKLRRTYLERVAERPELAGALERILEDATDELAAAARPSPPVRQAPDPSRLSVVDSSTVNWSGGAGLLFMTFDRRYHRKRGGGYWGECVPGKLQGKLPSSVHVEVPRGGGIFEAPLSCWTRVTVSRVLAIARSELAARGARGALRVSVTPSDAGSTMVSCVHIAVRLGQLRARVSIDAGTVHRAIPHEVLYALHEFAMNAPEKMKRAVQYAREQDAKASSPGGAR